jgi:hypothetical protein
MFDTFKNLCKSQDVLPPGNTHTKRLATGWTIGIYVNVWRFKIHRNDYTDVQLIFNKVVMTEQLGKLSFNKFTEWLDV